MAMSRAQSPIEYALKVFKLYSTPVYFKIKMRVGESPVGLIYIADILLANVRNYMYSNKKAQYLKYHPPSLTEYLTHKYYNLRSVVSEE